MMATQIRAVAGVSLVQGARPRVSFAAAPARLQRRSFVVKAFKDDEQKQEKQQRKVAALEDSLKKSGLDRQRAQQVLQVWKQAGGGEDVTADSLRKVFTKQARGFSYLVVVQTLLDLGAAYGSYTAGGFFGEAAQRWGFGAVALQALTYTLAGYYAAGVFFDLFKLGMLLTAITQFRVNSGAFLTAVQELAGESGGATGLGTVDKATEAISMAKVLSSLNRMGDLLKGEVSGQQDQGDAFRSLAAYLTLEKAGRLYNFDAEALGLDDAQAAQLATVFSAYDSDDNGVLSLDEFRRLIKQSAPELSDAEVKAALGVLDSNQDGIIQFNEFAQWWVEKQPASA